MYILLSFLVFKLMVQKFLNFKFIAKCYGSLMVTILIVYFFVQLQLWDTAGQERFRRSMVQHYYRNVNAVVFVYDVTRMSTFQVRQSTRPE